MWKNCKRVEWCSVEYECVCVFACVCGLVSVQSLEIEESAALLEETVTLSDCEGLNALVPFARSFVVSVHYCVRLSSHHVTVLCPEPNALVKALRKLPILHDEQYAQQTRLYEYYDPPENTLVLP